MVSPIPDINAGGRWKAFNSFIALQQIEGYTEDIHDQMAKGACGDLENGSQFGRKGL